MSIMRSSCSVRSERGALGGCNVRCSGQMIVLRTMGLVAVISAASLMGCGEAGDKERQRSESVLTTCLERAGAHHALTKADIEFANYGDASSGVIYDAEIDAMVQLWRQGSAVSKSPPQWMIWAFDPFGSDTRSVDRLMDERPDRSAVLYLRSPTRQQVGATESCVRAAERRNSKQFGSRPRHLKQSLQSTSGQ